MRYEVSVSGCAHTVTRSIKTAKVVFNLLRDEAIKINAVSYHSEQMTVKIYDNDEHDNIEEYLGE